jgi:hypothetical protein
MSSQQLQDTPVVFGVVNGWVRWLEGRSQQPPQPDLQQQQQQPRRPQVEWEPAHVWGALKTLLCDVLTSDALEELLAQCPALLPAVLAAAAAARVPARVRTHALHCLVPLLHAAKGSAWDGQQNAAGDDGQPLGPDRVVESLSAVTWSHVGDVPLLKALVAALPEVVLCALHADGDAAYASQGGGGSQEDTAAAAAAARRALLAAARQLVLVVPGSSVPPLVQAAGLEEGLRLVAQAMGEHGRPSSAGAHLWVWRAAAAVGAPDAAAAAVAVPAGMRGRVEEQAADLLVTALQVRGGRGWWQLCTSTCVHVSFFFKTASLCLPPPKQTLIVPPPAADGCHGARRGAAARARRDAGRRHRRPLRPRPRPVRRRGRGRRRRRRRIASSIPHLLPRHLAASRRLSAPQGLGRLAGGGRAHCAALRKPSGRSAGAVSAGGGAAADAGGGGWSRG